MASTDSTTQSHVRGLQFLWVPEHSFWIFVWCADDGDLNRNCRIAYSLVSSPSEFSPQSGQFILTKANPDNSDYTFVYGVPYFIISVAGSIKVYFQDFTPALANPRFATGEDQADTTNAGNDATKFGCVLEGQYCKEDLTNGPILWNLKDQNLHNNPSPVLEATDINDINSTFGAPCGQLLIQYQRDPTGRIVTNDKGVPKIAQIETSGDHLDTAQNFKIGYLGLTFKKDYFGIGLHGWIGAASASVGPFDFTSIDSTGKLTIYPGTVNNLLPDNPFDTLDCSVNDLTYVVVNCNCASNQVNQASYKAKSTPPTPAPAIKGAPPLTFDVLLGLVKKDSSGPTPTYKFYKTWPKNCNIIATPVLWITTDKEPQPAFGNTFDNWYSWNLTGSSPSASGFTGSGTFTKFDISGGLINSAT